MLLNGAALFNISSKDGGVEIAIQNNSPEHYKIDYFLNVLS